MKESVGNAGVIFISIIIIGVIIVVFVGSLNYTKALKVKNRIIDIIEQYEYGYTRNRNKIDEEIATVLQQIGYRVDTRNKGCGKVEGAKTVYSSEGNYRYCIYEHGKELDDDEDIVVGTERGVYYTVIAYMYFDLPLINDLLEIPVKGQTKTFYHVVDHGR